MNSIVVCAADHNYNRKRNTPFNSNLSSTLSDKPGSKSEQDKVVSGKKKLERIGFSKKRKEKTTVQKNYITCKFVFYFFQL